MTNISFVNATLRLTYTIGYDEQNEPLFATKSYRNLNSTHSTADLVAVANAMASLSSQPLASIVKQETTNLS
ncbi:DUF1659 domain-containing protein [Lysinibacillus sp. FSL H8-0500]|uniref:DUF1659 domain-containing protein n=1 Tax=Lysinibacillus sp. FSL H8-0500 TaxID=2921393 RepID=UPI0031014400